MSETRSSPVLYPGAQEQAQSILPSPPPPLPPQQPQATTQQPQPPPQPPPSQPQQRVHVIKKNIYLMTSNGSNSGNNGNSGGGTTSPMVTIFFTITFLILSFLFRISLKCMRLILHVHILRVFEIS